MFCYYQFNGRNALEFQRNLALFLSKFQPTADSAYVEMLRRLGHRNIIYSTLNYDMLLELSAEKLSFFPYNYCTRPSIGAINLLKPHGSINFWWDRNQVNFKNAHVSGSFTDGFLKGDILPVTYDEAVWRCHNEDSFSPAMAIYAMGKPVEVARSFISQQQKWWEEAI